MADSHTACRNEVKAGGNGAADGFAVNRMLHCT